MGPTLYTSGPLLDGDPPIFAGVSEPVANVEQARAVVARQAEAGYDLVKTYNFLGAEAFAAAVEEARVRRIAIGGHVPQEVSLEDALALRIDLVAHGDSYFRGTLDSATGRMDPARLDSLARATREAGTTVIPNIVYNAAFSAALQDSAAAFGLRKGL